MNGWMDLFEYDLDEGALTLLLACLGYDATRYHLAMSLMCLDSEMRGWIAWVYE
jgi:hypothetical protein